MNLQDGEPLSLVVYPLDLHGSQVLMSIEPLKRTGLALHRGHSRSGQLALRWQM